MVELEIYENIINIFEKIENKEIFIFGTGKGGKIASDTLRKLKIDSIKFLDNNMQMWGQNVNNVVVHSPKELLNKNKNNILILIACQAYKEISKQLISYGFEEDVQFYTLLSENSNKHINSEVVISSLLNLVKNDKTLDIQIFGDSVMSFISRNDLDKTTLYGMIKNNLDRKYNINGTHYEAFHLGIYYIVLHMLIYLKKIPSLIVLPINMHSFSPHWDIKPLHEYSEIFNDIKSYLHENGYELVKSFNLNKSTQYDDYLNYSSIYSNGIEKKNEWFCSWLYYNPRNDEEKFARYRNVYMWYLNYKLDTQHRKILVLREIIELCIKYKIKLISYITPVNYMQCRNYIGDTFVNSYSNNTNIIRELFDKYKDVNIGCIDYSMLFESEYFIHPHDIEHLNEHGRKKLANKVSNLIENGIRV